ncbi:MAG: hypothetical protein ACK8QZ_02100 [Anaerolineales bacterium]
MKKATIGKFWHWLKRRLDRDRQLRRIRQLALQVRKLAPSPQGAPVAFFNASSSLDDLSWNAAFHLLTLWALRLKGVPVAIFACQRGMSHCVLGTSRLQPQKPPPCRSCLRRARAMYATFPPLTNREGVFWFNFERAADLEAALQTLSVEQMTHFTWEGIPLGALCLPALRWVLRRHHLQDDADTRYLYREYILSAWNLAKNFRHFLDQVQPRAVVVFNGQFYPEAVARWVALQLGIRVITHEVGLQPASAFFTEGEATAYPIHIPPSFTLSEQQNARLDSYLSKRFRGDFSMAGIRFWPNMHRLDEAFLQQAAQFRQIVAVFTNVTFDTSQPHANTVFDDMFEWLEVIRQAIERHPETLFVIRAHPDELRPGKESQETVESWVRSQQLHERANVVFVPPKEYLSSYELIQHSKFVAVYNSTIGLEASIMGKAVLCGGRARFTQYPTVFFPQSPQAYQAKLEEFLQAESIEVPPEFRENARRFLYYQLFRTSLPFAPFLRSAMTPSHARLKPFKPQDLLRSAAIQTILHGLLENGDFLLAEEMVESAFPSGAQG